MNVSFWGVRGSFPVSAPEHMRYGGNTPCVEVASAEETVLIDAGTGIRLAGKSLVERSQKRIPLLLSHTHWDHIQGLPHFEPLNSPDTHIAIHSIRRDNHSLHDIVCEQQRSPFSRFHSMTSRRSSPLSNMTMGSISTSATSGCCAND